MKARTCFVAVAALALVLGIVASVARSQDNGQPGPSKEDMEMMAKWMEFATPGEAHQVLHKKAGKWNLVVKMWMEPGADAMESTATSDAKMIMDGRYLLDNTEGSAMGMPFQGMGLTAYDNLKKKYVAMWIDNMGTGIMVSEGTYDASTKTFHYASEMPEPTQGKYIKARTVERTIDADKWVMEMFQPDKTGKEYRSMEITYTRQK